MGPPVRPRLVTLAAAAASAWIGSFLLGRFLAASGPGLRLGVPLILPLLPSEARSAEDVTDAARRWILEGRPAGQPYFLFVSYMDAHTPYVPHENFHGRWPGLSGRLPFPRGRNAMFATASCPCFRAHPDFHAESLQSILEDGFKYIETKDAPPQLFDVAKDPGESRNLAEALPDTATRLREELRRWSTSLQYAGPSEGRGGDSRQRQEALEALGYLP